MSATIALTETAEKLKPVLSALPPTDRLGLADFLYDSVDVSITAEEYQVEWEAELMRRIDETQKGLGGEISGDEMRRIARETLK
jgi:putative addiction module component (TIGR02574 family)